MTSQASPDHLSIQPGLCLPMCGRCLTVSDLPIAVIFPGALPPIQMTPGKFQVSRDSQALYVTIVTKDRLPVFQTDAIKIIACQAIDEARSFGEFLLFASAHQRAKPGQRVLNLSPFQYHLSDRVVVGV